MIFKSAIAAFLLGFVYSSDAFKKKSNLRQLKNSNGETENGNGRGNNGNGGGNGNRNKNGTNDKKMVAPCTLLLRATDFLGENDLSSADDDNSFEWFCELDRLDNNGKSGRIVPFSEKKFKKNQKIPGGGQLESGVTTLSGDITIKNGKAIINKNPKFGRKNANKNGRHLVTSGDKTVLVLRVVANDTTTTSSETELANEIFGTSGDVFNLKAGFSQCSYGQLNFEPTPLISNGVKTVALSENVIGMEMGDIQGLVLTAATTLLGNLPDQFDHVMICTPNGATGGIAYAYINSWLSVYNDDWCNYPSAQLHEIGHNLGLAHSGEGSVTYGDQSGMMGYSYGRDDTPLMCFNNAKNWQLGWYDDAHTEVNPTVSSWSGDLIGFANYGDKNPYDTIVLKIKGDALDYYVGFNRKTGINAGTVEGGDQVTIQERSQGNGYAKSTLIAKLSTGGEHTIPNFGGGGIDAIVKVTNIDLTSNPAKASVEVFLDRCTTDAECNDGSTCTADVCDNTSGLCSFVPNGSCGNALEVDIFTDNYPGETTWNVIDKCNNDAEVLSGGPYSTPATHFIETLDPAETSQYTFTINDSWGDGICCRYGQGAYVVKFGGTMVAQGGDFGRSQSKTWGTCDNGPNPPSESPSASPSTSPNNSPSTSPSVTPTSSPSAAPSVTPTTSPSTVPSTGPTSSPSAAPSVTPTTSPSAVPSTAPTSFPTEAPSVTPTTSPSTVPSVTPTTSPSAAPSAAPSDCAMAFNLDYSQSLGVSTSWTITDYQSNQVVKSNSVVSNGLGVTDSDCIPFNCYVFTINSGNQGSLTYSLTVNGNFVGASNDAISEGNQITLFGTCL